MCRNIKQLFNFAPPATDEQIRAAAIQYVRKISGMNKPSQINELVFLKAVDEIANTSQRLLLSLQTSAPTKNRDVEAIKAKQRSDKRFGAPKVLNC